MGYSNWDQIQYTAYATSTNLWTSSRNEVFRSRKISNNLDPRNITLRESRDSEFNPQSTPVIFALDVTGSLGFVAESIAKNSLPEIMTQLYTEKPITDPHIMFMAFGDTRAFDNAPLQMSQFEADIRIVEQLRELWLEGGGGGNDSESVNMAWYAAAHLTDTDAFKRGKKGFLFTLSDEMVPPDMTRRDLERVFGKERASDMALHASNAELLEYVRTMYHTFHIIVEEGNYARTSMNGRSGKLFENWKEFMGFNVVRMQDHTELPKIIIAIMRIVNGEDFYDVVGDDPMLKHAFSAQS